MSGVGQVRASVGSPAHVLSAPNSGQNRCGAQSPDVRLRPTAVTVRHLALSHKSIAHGQQVQAKTQAPEKSTDKAEPAQQALPDAPAPLFSVGDSVHHHMFGDGKVESIQENKLTITFDGNVTKVIREDFLTRKR